MSASNSRECIKELIGQEIVGVLFDALPLQDRGLRVGSKTLVFKDGTGFTFKDGSAGCMVWWRESKNDIFGAVREKEAELASASNEHRAVLELAGLEALPPCVRSESPGTLRAWRRLP